MHISPTAIGAHAIFYLQRIIVMKSVTEFWNTTLFKGLTAKEALVAAGKTAEEIEASLGETFKLEGEKLKYFANAVDVAAQNKEKLHRVVVATLNEGEAAPQKATKVEEHHYIPYFIKDPAPIVKEKAEAGGKGKRRSGGGGPKSKEGKTKTSPWGLTPEEIAAKKGAKKS